MSPAPPLRSSALSSTSVLDPSITAWRRSRSPSGVSTARLKKQTPPIADTPARSTPFLPPSLMAAYIGETIGFMCPQHAHCLAQLSTRHGIFQGVPSPSVRLPRPTLIALSFAIADAALNPKTTLKGR